MLNAEGAIDHYFSVKSGVGFDDSALDVAPLPNGQFIVVGNFNSYNGKDASYAALINADGSLDSNFNLKLDGPAQKVKLSKDLKTAYISGELQKPQAYFLQVKLAD